MSEIPMPRLSDTMQEGTISHWLKAPGDAIKKGEVLAEIETDKATMDLEAYENGVLEKILVQEGETVPIGQAVAIIGSGASAQPQSQPTQTAPAASSASTESAASTTNQAPAAPVTQSQTTQQQPEQQTGQMDGASNGDGRGIKASPLARRMAEEHQLDLSQIQGHGPNGRIERADIEDALEQRGTPTTAAPTPTSTPSAATTTSAPETQAARASTAQAGETVPFTRMQSIVARRLSESKQTIPHFYVSAEVDMTDALALRQSFNVSAGDGGIKVSVNDLMIKAAALALEKFPEVNSAINGEQFVRYSQIHVGFAVDIPSGLVVPVIHDANIKGVRSIARESKALIEKARNNKLAPYDLEGGTFSISNLGMMDVTEFIAVINPPQAAILAIASTYKRFMPVNDQPVLRDVMTITLSADHRLLYGATVARFLQEVKRLLQNPYSLLG